MDLPPCLFILQKNIFGGIYGIRAFASREDVHKTIDSDMLSDPDIEGDLASFSTGDWIALQLYVSPGLGERIAHLLPLPGVSAYPDASPSERRPRHHIVEIAAIVAGKTHSICPDWMCDDITLRVADHTIVVQCASDEAQDVLLWVRSKIEPVWAQEKG